MMDSNSWILVFILLMLIWSLASRGRDPHGQRMERKLDALLKHQGIDMDQGVDPQLLELVRAGKKIEAIKLHRAMTGVGLKEAKDYVESL